MLTMQFGLVKKKLGPLPVWAWMGLILGAALGYVTWRRNQEETDADPGAGESEVQAPDTLQPHYTFIDADKTFIAPDTTQITVPPAPPGGGRPPAMIPLPPNTPKPVPVPYKGPAMRKPLPQAGYWDKGNKGWAKPMHSNFLAEYRGNYTNLAPPNSAEEQKHVSILRQRNASHGGKTDKPRSSSLIYLPPTLPF